MSDYVWDIETYTNVFLITIEHAYLPIIWTFEISDRRNQSREIVEWVSSNRDARFVGFNNIGFDYPVLHLLLRAGHTDAMTLYQKAQQIISSQDGEGRWAHDVKPSDRLIEQIDLYRIHHFDNVARATSLKVIEFNQRAPKVMDLPFPVGSMLTPEQIDTLIEYNRYDVSQTKQFYHATVPMIRFREELTHKYNRDFMNHNDTKIGKDYFVMMLEQRGVSCYDYNPTTGRTPRQTKRHEIRLADAILPHIQFQQPEFQRVLNYLRAQTITETKGVFKNIQPIIQGLPPERQIYEIEKWSKGGKAGLTATIDGFDFIFGTGGIHGSVSNQCVESDDDFVIVDLDVSSYYPNLAIVNRFYPEHLGETFCDIYSSLYEQRKQHAKGTAENAMLKLALNGVYGDSNNRFSVFYDPLFTMQITLNGQLLLCMLVEALIASYVGDIIQCNTDGITIRMRRSAWSAMNRVCNTWEQQTGLKLEAVEYRRMWIADVNSYIAEKMDGSVKRKGRYEYVCEWHQDQSALVVPKVAEQVLLHDAPIRATLENWPDPWDFLKRIRVPKTGALGIELNGQSYSLPNTTRYYVAKGGGQLLKWLPPLKNLPNWRRFAIEAGWGVQVCNDLSVNEARLPVDFDYYEREVEKLVLGVM